MSPCRASDFRTKTPIIRWTVHTDEGQITSTLVRFLFGMHFALSFPLSGQWSGVTHQKISKGMNKRGKSFVVEPMVTKLLPIVSGSLSRAKKRF